MRRRHGGCKLQLLRAHHSATQKKDKKVAKSHRWEPAATRDLREEEQK